MVEAPRRKGFTLHTCSFLTEKELHPITAFQSTGPSKPTKFRPSTLLSNEQFQLEFAPNHWGFFHKRTISSGSSSWANDDSLCSLRDGSTVHQLTNGGSRLNRTAYTIEVTDRLMPHAPSVCKRRRFSPGKRKARIVPSCGPDATVDASLEGEEILKQRDVYKIGGRARRQGRAANKSLLLPRAAFVSSVQHETSSLSTLNHPPRHADDLRALFDEIDVDGDGRLTEVELRAYAERQGLPTTYVREFLDLARQAHCHWGARNVRWPWQPQPLAAAAVAVPGRVPCQRTGDAVGWVQRAIRLATAPMAVEFCEFRQFVERKDEALRESFARIDVNGDGEITLAELEKGMRCVRVMCGGQYKPVRNLCIARMMKQLHKGRSSSIRYQEFRDYFTLLPSSEYLMDYWLESSCAPSVDLGSKFHVATPAVGAAGQQLYSVEPRGSPWNHLLAGGLAGAVSRTITAPLETLRLQMMVNAAATRGGGSSLSAQARALYRQAGWRAFFRGNLTNVVRSAPQKAIDFFAFEGYKRLLLRAAAGPIGMQLMTAGALAGATSTLVLYPLDVVRSRLTIQTSYGTYKGILDALTRISREEGVPSLYRGLRPSIVSIIPEAGITYGAFDMLKRTYLRVMKTEKVPIVPTMVCGVASASTGQFVAYPLELVARRLQVAGGKTSAHDIFVKILQEEGVCGLYRGIVPATLKMIPMAIISFGVYEGAKGALVWLSQLEEARKIEAASLAEEKQSRIQIRTECPPV